MASFRTFHASIAVERSDAGKLITDRLACRSDTRILKKREDPGILVKNQYRKHFLTTLRAAFEQLTNTKQRETDMETVDMMLGEAKPADKLLAKFVNLAETLEQSKALAIHFGERSDREEKRLTQAWNNALEDVEGIGYTLLDQRMALFDCPSVREGILHPLSVALLAYCLGGPINAANTAYAHTWKVPEDATNYEQTFHVEGDCQNLFDEYRVTLAWEREHEKAKDVSAKHHIFLTDELNPRLLEALNATEYCEDSPLTVIYNSKSVALYYDCPDPAVVRNSVTLDFHLNTVMDSEIQLFSPQSFEMDLQGLTMMKLLTTFPVANYTTLFRQLLFNDESLNAMIEKLSALDIATPPPTEDTSMTVLNRRLEGYRHENRACIPPAILNMCTDIPISGRFSSLSTFLSRLSFKARRDVHLHIGMNLCPQTPLDENRECARKLIRDIPGEIVEARLAHYAPILVAPYSSCDLISISALRRLATIIEHCCLQLIANGFVDGACYLPSIAALASAFGSALDGPKEIQLVPEPWIENEDLLFYRTRCLYLFWSADWLVYYLKNPVKGPLMMIDEGQATEVLERMRAEIGDPARLLLRNWVAWGLFMEQLPQGGFFVRQPGSVIDVPAVFGVRW